MTVKEAAAELGVSRQRIHALIKGDRLRATKKGRDYNITPGSLKKLEIYPHGVRGKAKKNA